MAEALGYGAIWRTGDVATNDQVRKGLSLSSYESITGFIYVGDILEAKPISPAVDKAKLVQYWR